MAEESKEQKLEQGPAAPQKEKLEFLRRTEIRTMQKDIARLREREAQKERERITVLKPKKIREKRAIERIRKEAEEIKRAKEIKKPAIDTGKIEKEQKDVLEQRENQIQKELKDLLIKEASSREKKGSLLDKITQLKANLEKLLVEEKKIEETEEKVEERERRVITKEEKRNIEKERWEVGQIRKTIEAERWKTEESVQGFQKMTREIEFELPELQKQVAKLEKEREDIRQKKRDLELGVKKKVTEKKAVPLMPELRPRKFSSFRKLLVRVLVILFIFSLLGFLVWSVWFKKLPGEEPLLPPEEEVVLPPEELEGKIGQLFIIGFEEKTLTPELEAFFRKYKPGGVLLLSRNIQSQEQLKRLISDLQELSLEETALPLFIAVDQEGEPMSRIGFLEEKTGQPAIDNIDVAFLVGQKRGAELEKLGVNLNLAPVLDNMGVEDFYFNRTFQKPPRIAGELAKSLVSGQKDAGILTAIKHFPGYVGISFNPENRIANISLPEISQFKKAMEAGPELVMVSNVIYREVDPSLPLTFSPQGIQLLKDSLGSEVLIISDDLAQNSLLGSFSIKEIVSKPIEAGVDILLFSGWRVPVESGLDAFFEAVERGEISEEKISAAVSRVISLKQKIK